MGIFVCVHYIPPTAVTDVDCIDDYSHNQLLGVNSYFNRNSTAKKAAMIGSALLCDIITLAMFCLWTVAGRTWRFPIALVGNYLCRFLCASLFKMKYPANMIWEYPGFHSLTVNYGSANDMHFCVHIALLMVIFLELWQLKLHKFAIVTFMTLFSQIFLILSLQGAYSIDVFGGLVFGHFFWSVGYHYSYLIDCNIFGLTF
jgi:hypothetical protein